MNHPCKIELHVMTRMMHPTGIQWLALFPKFFYRNFRLNLGAKLQTRRLITVSNLDFKPAPCLCCLLSTAYLWGLTFQRPVSELKDSVDHALGLWSVYDLKRHSRRCGLEMSIGLTRLNTSKAFHGAASSASRIFRSHTHTYTHIALFEISLSALHILNCDFFLFACRVIFKPDFKSHFSVLQSSKDRFHPRRQASEQAKPTHSNQPYLSALLFVILGVSVKPLHSPQTCFFFVFVFEVGGKYGIESRGGKGGGGVAYQTEVAYICDHGPMFFSVCC